MGAYEEVSRRKTKVVVVEDSVVCPKPRWLGYPSLHIQTRTMRFPLKSHETEMVEAEAGVEILDVILAKGGHAGEKPGYEVASSLPFYCGSPPSRASNPIIQDSHFGTEITIQPSPADFFFSPTPSSMLATEHRGGGGGGCITAKFRNMPVAVRIEGFDCLSQDRHNCSISAMA